MQSTIPEYPDLFFYKALSFSNIISKILFMQICIYPKTSLKSLILSMTGQWISVFQHSLLSGYLSLFFWDQGEVMKTWAGWLDTHREKALLFPHHVKIKKIHALTPQWPDSISRIMLLTLQELMGMSGISRHAKSNFHQEKGCWNLLHNFNCTFSNYFKHWGTLGYNVGCSHHHKIWIKPF